jgi:putative phage-type endonuclease
MSATLHAPIQPGSPEWYRYMTGSKIAAVLGLSPYQSRFSLWHRMNGTLEPEPTNDEQRRGHYLEPAIRQWWEDQHPGYLINEVPDFYVNDERPWQGYSPDAVVLAPDGVVLEDEELFEAKSGGSYDEWGPEDSEEIPVYYRAQVMWGMSTLNLPRAHVAALLPYLEFRAYVIERNQAECDYLIREAEAFMQSLQDGVPPDLDGHTETYRAVKALHPEIDGSEIEVTPEIGADYLNTCSGAEVALRWKTEATTRLLDAMGSARYAIHDGRRIAQRVAGNGRVPHLRPCGKKIPK